MRWYQRCKFDPWVGKNAPANAGDAGSIPGLERSPGERNGYLLKYSCLGNPMDTGAWWAIYPMGCKSQALLSDYTTTTIL